MLKALNLGLQYKNEWVFRNLTLQLKKGESVALVGRSGCGKSTLLQCLAGLLKPDEGEIQLNDKVVHKPGHAAYLPQKNGLLDCYTAIDNTILPLRMSGVSKKEALEMAAPLFNEFGLGHCMHHYPYQLSGGMAQRAALIRAKLCKASILLLDEPLAALDAITRREMQQWMAQSLSRFCSCVMLVTHDVEEALILGIRILVMHGSPARLTEIMVPSDGKSNEAIKEEMYKLLRKP